MTKVQIQEQLERCYWRYARTLSFIPHHYTLRQTWNNQDLFNEIVLSLREHGVEEKFGKKTFLYCYLGNFKYWTMGNPVEITKLINKVQINFGRS